MSPPPTFPDYLRTLYALWNARRGMRVMPSRSDFRTEELQPWLSELHLVSVRPEGFRFTVFAAGPASRYGHEMSGRYVCELEPATLAVEIQHAYRAVVETRTPVFGIETAQPFRGLHRSWSRLILPLSDDGLAVDRLLVAMWDDSINIGFGARSRAVQELMTSKWVLAETFENELPHSVPSGSAEMALAVAG